MTERQKKQRGKHLLDKKRKAAEAQKTPKGRQGRDRMKRTGHDRGKR